MISLHLIKKNGVPALFFTYFLRLEQYTSARLVTEGCTPTMKIYMQRHVYSSI